MLMGENDGEILDDFAVVSGGDVVFGVVVVEVAVVIVVVSVKQSNNNIKAILR